LDFSTRVWWSRFARPRLHGWQDREHPLHLVEQSWQKGDPDPKALGSSGVLWQTGSAALPDRSQMNLRFVTGRPVSDITTQFLSWCCEQVAKQGKTSWLLIWDNTSWQDAQKGSIRAFVNTIGWSNERAKAFGFCPCFCRNRAPG